MVPPVAGSNLNGDDGSSRRSRLLWGAVIAPLAVGVLAGMASVIFEYGLAKPIFEPSAPDASSLSPAPAPPEGSSSPLKAASRVSDDVEKAGLGGNSYCGRSLDGPGSIQWRVCLRVERDSVVFGTKLVNTGNRPESVVSQVEYTSANQWSSCPGSGRWEMTVAPGETAVSPLGECRIPLRRPVAYAAVGWLVPAGQVVNHAAYQLSPSAHVYDDVVRWRWVGGGAEDVAVN
jgi:hypothetical protein